MNFSEFNTFLDWYTFFSVERGLKGTVMKRICYPTDVDSVISPLNKEVQGGKVVWTRDHQESRFARDLSLDPGSPRVQICQGSEFGPRITKRSDLPGI